MALAGRIAQQLFQCAGPINRKFGHFEVARRTIDPAFEHLARPQNRERPGVFHLQEGDIVGQTAETIERQFLERREMI